jgi:dTDP-4-dehydrorhamnose 3,5-epimerase
MIQKFSFEKLKLDGAYRIDPFVALDERGSFIKDYSKEVFEQNNISHKLQEVFYTISVKGVIRAIHFQHTKQQAKLVRCISGRIYDIIIDLRKNSPTFKEWCGFELSGDNKKEIYVPEGFGHGYLVLENSIVSYKCSEKFYSEYDDGIMWNDQDLAIKWPLDWVNNKIIVSEKDQNLQSFAEFLHSTGGGF